MLKKIVNAAMVLSVCLSIGYAKPLKECKSERDKMRGCVEKKYYDNGQLQSEAPYNNGEINGIWKWYYESGQLKSETPYENDKKNGVRKEYYESGKLRAEIPYGYDKKKDVSKDYYESGQLKNVYTKMVRSLSIKSITNKGSL